MPASNENFESERRQQFAFLIDQGSDLAPKIAIVGSWRQQRYALGLGPWSYAGMYGDLEGIVGEAQRGADLHAELR